MSTLTLVDRAAGQTILEGFFNDIHSSLKGDVVGRNSSGVATAGQNLGTASLPWGTGRFNTLVVNGLTLDPSIQTAPQNRVSSGQKRSTSNQPAYLKPAGSSNALTIEGLTTSLVLDINGTAVTVAANLTASSLTVAPSTNNTALVDDAAAVGQEATRIYGESGSASDIIVDTMGSEITALVGKFAAFKIVSGANTEYFLAFVESTTKLSKCLRGFFYNSTYAPINRIKFSNNDTITLMRLGWTFVENNASTVDVAYTVPHWGFESPTSPVTGDYWYDLGNSTWKRYDGASFVIINRTLVGLVVLDSVNAVAGRSIDFFKNYRSDNTVELEKISNSTVRTIRQLNRVNVAGNSIEFQHTRPLWDIATDLAGSADLYNASEQANTLYYLYVKDDGNTVISDISPYIRPDLLGNYHPHNPWRQVGTAQNDGSSNFSAVGGLGSEFVLAQMTVTGGITTTATRIDGFWAARKSTVIKKLRLIAGNSGSGTTTLTINRNAAGPSGSTTATASFTGNSAAKSQETALSADIGAVDGDFGDIDLTARASGLEDITVLVIAQ